MTSTSPLIEIEEVSVHFEAYGELGLQGRRVIRAVDQVSLRIMSGEVICLVGESGSGKTTLARAIVGLLKPTSGRILVDGRQLNFRRSNLKQLWKTTQMIFQDPYSTFNQLATVYDALVIPLQRFGIVKNDGEAQERVQEALIHVGLKLSEVKDKYPNQLSGGQRQRAAIAKALLVKPRVIIADEPVSMLDVSLRAGILELLRNLNVEQGVTIVFITHDLAVAQYISDRIAVMYRGQIVEMARTRELIESPLHPYTELLLKSTPRLKGGQSWSEKQDIAHRVVDFRQFQGCRFYARCPISTDVCISKRPELQETESGHYVACYLRQTVFQPEFVR